MCQKFHNGNLRAHSFIAHSTTKTSSLRTLDISTTRCCFKCRLNVLPKLTKPFVSITCIRPSWDASVSSKNTLIIIDSPVQCTSNHMYSNHKLITSLFSLLINFHNRRLPPHHNQHHPARARSAESARAVTGRRCPHSGRGGRLFEPSAGFFYGNSWNSGSESQKIVSKVGN